MYVITGATGNTGKPLAESLLKAGQKVRIISRNADKAKELVGQGAELFLGDTSQIEMLKKAFQGATAVYAMIPIEWTTTDYYGHQKKHADVMATALADAGVPYVVSLSSVGTHLEKDSGVVLGLRYMEQKFNVIQGLNALHLRPTYFMENTLGQIGMIKQAGITGSPVRPDLVLSMIATRDISNYAASRLLALDFKGKQVQYLLGQRDVTYTEVASVLGKAIGKPDLKYLEIPYSEFKKGFMSMGASENLGDTMNTFIKALNDGKVLADCKREAGNTTPTSIEDFAQTFAHIFKM
jgi:uncharacterized protein YbjT (DUF2867 family)